MPSRYRLDAGRLKAEIVARVDAGETVRAVCGSPGMPSEVTVRNWTRSDAAFAAALAAAKRRGPWRRVHAFDEAKAAAFLARARAGETVNSLIGQPGMPSRATYAYWSRTLPWFAEATFALRQRRDAAIGAHGRARRRPFDQRLADRIVARLWAAHPWDLTLEDLLRSDPELPCWETVARWRREAPEFGKVMTQVLAARRRRGWTVPEILVDDVTHHIVMGGSFLSYSHQPGGPSQGTLRRWMRDPAFARAVAQACEIREDLLWDEIADVAETIPPGPVREMERAIGPLKRRIVTLRNRPTKPLGIAPRKGKPRAPYAS